MSEKNNEVKAKMKITIKIGDESEFTVENISERLSELYEKAEEIKNRLEELQFILPDEMNSDVYDKWDDALDDIGEYLDEIESLIEEAEEIENEDSDEDDEEDF